MNKMNLTALAAAISAAGFHLYADIHERAIEDLQNKLLTLNEEAQSIQARADGENRQLTDQEQADVNAIFAAFEDTKAEIERRKQMQAMQRDLSTAMPRAAQHDDQSAQMVAAASGTPAAARAAAPAASRTRTPRVEAIEDKGKFGFRSFGEFAMCVRNASARGGVVDPRLLVNANPTTYSQEGVGADGGFVVPPDFRTEIMRKVLGEESLLTRTDQQTTSSNSFTVPIDETTPWQTSGGIQAYWENEAGLKTQSKVAMTEMTTKLNKLISLVPVTDELLEDASSLTSYLRSKAPEKMLFRVNDALVNGSGAGQPLGFLNGGATITVNPESGQVADSIRFENILNMWGRMYAPCRRNAIWLANQDVEQQLMQLGFKNGTDHPVYMPPGGLADAPYGRLLGRPVVISEAVPTLGDRGDLSLVDMSTYLSIVKTGGIRNDVSIHLWFDYDITAFRFVMRIGGQPWWRTPVTRRNGSNTLSCAVTLGERA